MTRFFGYNASALLTAPPRALNGESRFVIAILLGGDPAAFFD
jgi:hypothetical protein